MSKDTQRIAATVVEAPRKESYVFQPGPNGFDGSFLMDNILSTAERINEIKRPAASVGIQAESIDASLVDPVTDELLYRRVEDIPPELYEKLAQKAVGEIVLKALNYERSKRIDAIRQKLDALVNQHYLERRLQVVKLPGVTILPLSQDHFANYVPTVFQRTKGTLVPKWYPSPTSLTVRTRFGSDVNVRTHNPNLQPQVDVHMLD